jgi:hypothetical protein
LVRRAPGHFLQGIAKIANYADSTILPSVILHLARLEEIVFVFDAILEEIV